MGVLIPWKRVVKTVTNSHSLKEAHDSKSKAHRTLASVIGLFCLIGIVLVLSKAIYYDIASSGVTMSDEIWEAGSVVDFDGAYCVVRDSNVLSFWGPFGKLAHLPRQTLQAVTYEKRAYGLTGDSIITCDALGKSSVVGPSLQQERLLPCPGLSSALLIRPGNSGLFGEPWLLRRVSPDGQVIWDISVPGIPAVASASDRNVALGFRDVAAGGVLKLARIDSVTGQISWLRTVGNGHWRDIAFTDSGNIAAATSSQVIAVDPEGKIAWSHSAKGELKSLTSVGSTVLTACEIEGRSVFAWPGAKRSIFKAFSCIDGGLVWEKTILSGTHDMLALGNSVIALCQNHVIGFSLEDGEREFLLQTGDLPLALSGDALLLARSSGVYLVRVNRMKASSE